MHLGDGCLHVEDHMQGLRDHQAVEGGSRQRAGLREVADEGCGRVVGADMQHVLPCDALRAEAAAVRVVAHLEQPARDVVGVAAQELLYVEAIDRCAPIEAEVVADGPHTTDVAEAYRAERKTALLTTALAAEKPARGQAVAKRLHQ